MSKLPEYLIADCKKLVNRWDGQLTDGAFEREVLMPIYRKVFLFHAAEVLKQPNKISFSEVLAKLSGE